MTCSSYLNLLNVLYGESGLGRSLVHQRPAYTNVYFMYCVGQVGWGIAWFINDLLVPELEFQRGRTYTFTVEGGNNPEDPSNYHPFYITDSISGGYLFNTPEQRAVRYFFTLEDG